MCRASAFTLLIIDSLYYSFQVMALRLSDLLTLIAQRKPNIIKPSKTAENPSIALHPAYAQSAPEPQLVIERERLWRECETAVRAFRAAVDFLYRVLLRLMERGRARVPLQQLQVTIYNDDYASPKIIILY